MNTKRTTLYIARGIFTGRVAIWGVVVPLAVLVVAWCAILVTGDEDAAIAFGARSISPYAWWLGSVVSAIVVRRIVSHSLLARRRRARREEFHRLLTEEYGHPLSRLGPEPRPAVTLAEVIVAILILLMILALAAPAASSPDEEDFILFGTPAAVLGAAGLLVAVALRRQSERAETCRRRFGEWKSRRESRCEARAAAGTEGSR